ncbi:MAG: hypothetical protein AAFR59_18345, partial [Bacteroidota bacterium]
MLLHNSIAQSIYNSICTMPLETFDPRSIEESSLRRIYEYLPIRAGEVSDSFIHAYLDEASGVKIDFQYVHAAKINAWASFENLKG